MKDGANVTIVIKYEVMYGLSIAIFTFEVGTILTVAKVTHISITNVSLTVTYKENITLAIV